MSFLSPIFLPALLLAAGPFLIHLLNRRRYRTLAWAAMDFLREAIHRNRRFLVFRDVLLLALRTLTVLLFVLAMARPYRLASQQAGYAGEPVHAVLVIDNSLSMGYTQLNKSLLDVAREKAEAFLADLPDGSKISLVPMCDYADWHGRGVLPSREAALEALGRLEVVDRKARASEAAEAAAAACRAAPDLPTKRVVFLGDVQAGTWAPAGAGKSFADLPDVQVVQLAPRQRTNTSVADFHLRDGVADARSPAVFVATLHHEGPEGRPGLRVALRIDGEVVEERTVDLLPGQNLELLFQHTFAVAGTAAEPLFRAATLELAPDRLDADDTRTIIVPVVADVPVVFVDQYGRGEEPLRNRYGETFPLRRLLAPRTERGEEARGLVAVRHRKMDELTVDDLKDAHLVVVAGVARPDEHAAGLLRQYVEQGGALFLAAGADFEPDAWQAGAWRDGAGILPAPLKPAPVGKLPPPDAVEAPAFHLAAATLTDEAFQLDLDDHERQEVLGEPFFYKAVVADLDAAGGPAEAETRRLEARRKWLAGNDADEKRWAELERRGELTEADRQRREADRQRRRQLEPAWLLWRGGDEADLNALPVSDAVQRGQPRVMGRYDNGEVFAVRRDVGRGRVVMMTTGCFPRWNNLAAEYGVVLLDKLLRGLLARTLPNRTFGPVREVFVPVDSADQGAEFTVTGPGGSDPQPARVEARGGEAYGLILRSVQRRGCYRVQRRPSAAGKTDGWTMLLAVNGPADESELASLGEEDLSRRLEGVPLRWVGGEEPIRLEGATRTGQDYWKYLMVLAMACLIAEMAFLMAPRGSAGGASVGQVGPVRQVRRETRPT